MYGKILFVAGAAVGYVVGTRRGRRDYEMIKRKASELWLDPRVQKAANKAGEFVEDTVPVVGPKISGAVDAATKAARGSRGGSNASGPNASSTGSSSTGSSTGSSSTGSSSSGSSPSGTSTSGASGATAG